MLFEYSGFINSAYSLKPYFSFHGPQKSPLQLNFLASLNKLWLLATRLHSKIFKQPLYLWPIRLNILIALIEEEHFLLSLITHLVFTFKQIQKQFSSNIPPMVVDFFRKYEFTFENNFKAFA